MLQRILFSLILSGTLVTSFAQTGTIKGNVKDATNIGIVGANVIVLGTSQGTVADVDGNFEITKVKSGKYDLVVSFISYKSDTLKNVSVYADQTTVVNSTLVEEGEELDEVVVSGTRVKDTDFSIITEIRNNNLVVAGISAQQISMSQDRDAAQVIRRVPGVTIRDGKFVNVRGLNERYNTVLLDGVIAPSTEVDSKAFAFDLIPSNMIDQMLVFKSGNASLPGEFAGANINVVTKSVIDEDMLSVNITTGFRAGTTFDSFYKGKGSKSDWLGYDNGSRDLPSSFPSANLREFGSSDTDRQRLTEASRSLPNTWGVTKSSAAPDYRATINFAKSGYIGGKRISNITSLSYSNTRIQTDRKNYYYEEFRENEGRSDRRYAYDDQRFQESVRVGLISNFIFEFNPDNRIEFRSLFNQQGQANVTLRGGVEDMQAVEVNNQAINYAARGIYSGQLQGKHNISDRSSLKWGIAYSSVGASQPDYKRVRSQRPVGTDNPYSVIIPPNANSFDAGRFYSDLKENVYTHTLDFDLKLNPEAEEDKQAKISIGYYGSYTARTFDARWFSYSQSDPFNNPTPVAFKNQSFTTIFNDENIGFAAADGQPPYLILQEGTNFSDSYKGQNIFGAGYANVLYPFGKFKLNTGVRVEYNQQKLDSYTTSGRDIKVDNPVNSVLPFVNLSYNLTTKSLFRLAYSKSVNRPVFRELAPFNFYDFDRNADVYGNPDLKTANIHNVDLRWELYPSGTETIALGVFYKYFIDPIEQQLNGAANLIYSYRNAESATNYGAEIEVRKSLSSMTTNNFLEKISISMNAAWIYSKVDLGDVDQQEKTRAMQGQSPYIFNANLFYTNMDNGWQVNLSHNIFGKRIFAVGDLDDNATQYEMPRHQLDATISKEFGKLEVKFGVQDILNAAYKIKQDSNRDSEIKDVDEVISTYKTGQYVSLGFTYRLR